MTLERVDREDEWSRDANGHLVPTDDEPVSVGQAEIGPDGKAYPYISDSAKTISVPGDYPTIQEAIDSLPRRLHHQHVIDIDAGTYDEDLLVERIQNLAYIDGTMGTGSAGENTSLQIIGDRANPSNVKVNSATVNGCVGKAIPQFWGIEWQGANNPYSDDPYCVGFHGPSSEGFIGDCAFTANADTVAEWAVIAYGGHLHIRDTDFGTDQFHNGVVAKRQGSVHSRNLSGSMQNAAYRNVEFSDQYIQDGGLSGKRVLGQGGEIRRDGAPNYQHDGDKRGTTVVLSSAPQSVPSGTWTKLQPDSVSDNHLGEWDGTNYQFVAPEWGTYSVEYKATFLSVSSGTELIGGVMKNDSTPDESQKIKTVGGAGTHTLGDSVEVSAGPGDTFHVRMQHNEGASLDVNNYAPNTYLKVNKV